MKNDNIKEKVLENVKVFVEKYFINESGRPITLTPYQEEFIKSVLKRESNKYIFLASTRVGKTEACAVLSTLIAMLYEGEEVVIVAPVFKQSERMFKRIRTYFNSNKYMSSFLDKTKSVRRDEINLINGSVMRCLSAANPEGLLGFGATTLVVDEAGSIPDNVIKTRILRMTASAAARGRMPVLIMLGTPHIANYFYEAWSSEDFVKFKVTWEDGVKSGILDRREVEYAKKVMTEDEFRMWFEAEFIPEERGLFNLRLIDEIAMLGKQKEPREGFDYYAGLDVARFGNDESAFVVLSIPRGLTIDESTVEMVYCSSRAKRALTDIAGWAKNLVEIWKPKVLIVDEIGLGSGVLDMLKEKIGNVVQGVSLMGKDRIDAYLWLSEMINSRKIILLNDEKLKYQFRSYDIVYQSDGKPKVVKKQGAADDLVDALALAVYAVKSERGENWYISDGAKEFMGVDTLRVIE